MQNIPFGAAAHVAILGSVTTLASGQMSSPSVYVNLSTNTPSTGQMLFVDIVLDATSYGGDFFAWEGASFDILVERQNSSGDYTQVDFVSWSSETEILETAETVFSGGGTVPGSFLPWVNGRRPGTLPAAPAAAGLNGSARTDTPGSDVLTVLDPTIGSALLSTEAGVIAPRQAPPVATPLIHAGRVYEVFRLGFEFDFETMGFLSFTPILHDLTLFTDESSTASISAFDQAQVFGAGLLPAPGSSAPLALAGRVTGRRRRRPHILWPDGTIRPSSPWRCLGLHGR